MEGIGCGGVIIGANWVLTSAECCDGATMKDLFTAANDWDYNTYYDTETIHIPDRKIIHPGSVLRFSFDFEVLHTLDRVCTEPFGPYRLGYGLGPMSI